MSETKICLEYPYSKDWKSGYLNVNSENRATLSLYNSHHDRSSTQYARYLMAVHLGRYLGENEHVDHINNDKTDNRIDNLQILTLKQNNIKSNKQPDIVLICPVCKKQFTRTRSKLRGRRHKIKTQSITCSRQCGAIFGHMNRRN